MKNEILYCYIRVSTDEQKLKDYSPKRQKELGIKKAKELDMPFEIMEEGAASASKDDFSNRPVFARLMQLVKDGTAKNIYAFDQTRLSRNNDTKNYIESVFIKNAIKLYTNSKFFDFKNSEDNLTFKIIQAVEQFESVLRKSRFQLGYVSANKAGRFLKGIPPFGYKKGEKGFLIIDSDEKQILLKMVELYLEKGFGTNQIAKWLNENKVPTKTSKVLKNGYTLKSGIHNRKKEKKVDINTHWNPGTINSIFKNEIYTGKRKFKSGIDTWEYTEVEPIIDAETFEKIQLKRYENAITKKKEDKYFYLLKGLLVCGKCSSAMHGRIKPNRGESTYRCNSKRNGHTSCKSQGINIEKLNEMILISFRDTLHYKNMILEKAKGKEKSVDAIEDKIEENVKVIKKHQIEIKNIESRIQQILTSYSSDLSDKTLKNAINTLNQDIKDFENKVAFLQADIKSMKDRINTNKNNPKTTEENYLKDSFLAIEKYLHRTDHTKDENIKVRGLLQTTFKNIFVLWIPSEKSFLISMESLNEDEKNENRKRVIKMNASGRILKYSGFENGFFHNINIHLE